MTKKRIISYDIMRIIAALMVVIIHSHTSLTVHTPNSFSFVLVNFLESATRIAVPVFIMITGALLLNEEREFRIKDGIKKAFDMFILVSIWSVIYAFATPLINGNLVLGGGWLETVIYGHYHLWYLYMLVGLYLVTPILKKIAKKENANIVLYYILIFTVVKGIFPLLNHSFNGITGTENWIAKYVSMFNIDHFTLFITYSLLGWYIANVEISRKSRIKIYVAGIVGFLITFGGTQLISIMDSEPNELLYKQSGFNVIIYAAAFFTFFHYRYKDKETVKGEKFIRFVAPLTFGVYLIHAVILHLLSKTTLPDNIFAEIFIPWALSILVSFALTFVISKIPIIKKLIRG